MQLRTARFLGTFLENLSDAPKGVVAFIEQQLGIQNLAAFVDYCQSVRRKAHPVEIRRRYGFRDFSDISARFRLNRWLYALCWTGTDRPGMLFDRAVAWLITKKVLLPGATVLERQVARIRNRAQARVWSLLVRGISAETAAKLEALLRIPVFAAIAQEDLAAAVDQVDHLVRPQEDIYYQELCDSFRRVRTFLPSLLRTPRFGATSAGQPVLEALEYLRKVAENGRTRAGNPPRQVVMGVWRRYLPEGESQLDWKAYVFCCLDRLRSALRRRDLFVQPSFRYGDARIGLLNSQAWEAARPTICRSLDHSLSAEETLVGLGRQLNHVYHQVAANLA